MSPFTSTTTTPLPTSTALLTSLITSLSTLTRQPNSNPALQAQQPHTTQPPPSTTLPQAPRPLLLTLHLLSPHCLLDALDLLDRRLVTRLVVRNNNTPPPPAPSRPSTRIQQSHYHVRTARPPPPSHGHQRSAHTDPPYTNTTTSRGAAGELGAGVDRGQGVEMGRAAGYHVHTAAWHCSCPAFAFAAFAGGDGDERDGDDGEEDGEEAAEMVERWRRRCEGWMEGEGEGLIGGFRFGGLARGGGKGGGPAMCKHLLACVLAEECPGLFGLGGAGGVVERVVCVEEVAGWAAGWGGG